jgi:hypothetical protein
MSRVYFFHISPHQADLYFNEFGLWSQRVVTGQAPRRNRRGRPVTKTLWARIPPALQLPAVFHSAVGREMRRTKAGGIDRHRQVNWWVTGMRYI